MRRFKKFVSLFLFYLILLLLTIFNVKPTCAQQHFSQKVFSALSIRNDTTLTLILKNNRLLVKPFIDSLLTEHIQQDLLGKKQEASTSFQFAQKIAELFEEIFNEKSLTTAIKTVATLSKIEKQKKLLADSLYAAGTKIRTKKQQHEQAIKDYQEALSIYKKIGDKRGEGTVLGGLGFVFWYRILWFKEDPSQAIDFAQQALKIRQEVDDKKLIGNSYNDIAGLHFQFLKDYSTALSYYLKAAKIREKIGDQTYLARTFAAIAAVYDKQGEFLKSLNYYEKSIQLFIKLNDQYRLANTLNDAGITLTILGNYPKALDYLQQSLAIKKKRNDQRRMVTTLSQLSIVYRKLGELELALESCQEIIKISEQIKNNRGLANAYEITGIILRNLGRYSQAINYFQKSQDYFKKLNYQNGIANALSNIGLTHFDTRDFQTAEDYLLKALQMNRELNERQNETINLINLGNLYGAINKLDVSYSHYEKALSHAISLNNPELIWSTFLGMGDNFEKRGKFDQAINYYTQALETVEGIREKLMIESHKASFMGQKRYVYEAVIHLLGNLYEKEHDQQYKHKAFELAERAKARALLDVLKESLSNVREGADQMLLAKEENTIKEISSVQLKSRLESNKMDQNEQVLSQLKIQLDSLQQNYKKLQREIRQKNPRYSDLQFPQTTTLQEVQSNLLDKNTLLLEYSLGDSSSALWCITNNETLFFLLPPRNVLQAQWETLRFAISQPQNKNMMFFTQSSNNLFKLLVEPVKDLLSKKKQLIIIPDGFLHYLPFEVLLTQSIAGDGHSYSELPFLINTIPVSYSQSVTVLRMLKEEQQSKPASYHKQLFAIGDPVFEEETHNPKISQVSVSDTTRGSLSRLIYSGKEVEHIASLFPREQVDLYLRNQATEECVKEQMLKGKYRAIHFATHGIINEKNPDYSSIVFTQDSDPKEDGFLHAMEIFNLNFSTDLVVLSACQTGLGKMVRGEGIMGLTRAFMYAGAPSTLVSLWSVSDISTSDLMQNFYKNLIENKQNKSKALQNAKIEILAQQKFSHPFYWAPFVLVGNWE